MASFAPTSAGETKEGDEVATFLRSHNLEEYHAKFIDEGYDSLSRLKNIELVDLVEDIGMKKGHARQLLREIADLVILQQYPSEPVQPPKREASNINMATDANHPPTVKGTKIILTRRGECEYNGDMIDGKANGHGEGIWKKYAKGSENGPSATYIGLWENDERCGQGTITYVLDGLKTSAEYVGGYKNGFRHGEGTMTHSKNGWKYIGFWENDLFHGSCTSYTDAQGHYVGEYKNNLRCGHGTQTYAGKGFEGHTYVGSWADNKRDGVGTYTYGKTGEKYVGDWVKGKQEGEGSHVYKSGDTYVGGMKNGMREGQGTYTYKGLTKGHPDDPLADDPIMTVITYVGSFKNNERNGHGKQTAAYGETYEGEFKDGLYEGHGTQTYGLDHAGETYVGSYKKGHRWGQGTYTFPSGQTDVGLYEKWMKSGTKTYPSGSQYVGEFAVTHKNHREGKGIYTVINDGELMHKYDGEWMQHQQHGQGTSTWASGDRYVGEYRNGKQHGTGTYTWANGNEYVGEYRNDKKHGNGKYTDAAGNTYVGGYKEGKQFGSGTETLVDGTSWTGEWDENGEKIQ